jgi:hypothetical protein
VNTTKAGEKAKARRKELQRKVFTLLCGGTLRCMCFGCVYGFTLKPHLDQLECDHIDGKGAAHRLALKHGTGGARTWKDIWNMPEIRHLYQVLCCNCNSSKFNGPCCKHEGESH